MRHAFIAPLLLRASRAPRTRHLPTTQRLHKRRCTRLAGSCSMSLEPLEKFQTTPFPGSVDLATGLLQSLPTPLTPAHEERVQALLSCSAGARGLFVALLSAEELTLAETPVHEGLCGALRGAGSSSGGGGEFPGEGVVTLGVKNVVMSSAMVVTYTGRGEMELAGGSAMTRRRAVNVLRVLDGLDVAREMVRGLKRGEGRFEGFAEKWGYGDAEIDAAVEGLREACGDAVLEE